MEEIPGAGGAATGRLARNPRMNDDRAIKVLHPRFAQSESTRTRFMHEDQAQRKHPNILMVDEVVDAEQGVYRVVDFAGALGRWLPKRQPPVSSRPPTGRSAPGKRAGSAAWTADDHARTTARAVDRGRRAMEAPRLAFRRIV